MKSSPWRCYKNGLKLFVLKKRKAWDWPTHVVEGQSYCFLWSSLTWVYGILFSRDMGMLWKIILEFFFLRRSLLQLMCFDCFAQSHGGNPPPLMMGPRSSQSIGGSTMQRISSRSSPSVSLTPYNSSSSNHSHSTQVFPFHPLLYNSFDWCSSWWTAMFMLPYGLSSGGCWQAEGVQPRVGVGPEKGCLERLLSPTHTLCGNIYFFFLFWYSLSLSLSLFPANCLVFGR